MLAPNREEAHMDDETHHQETSITEQLTETFKNIVDAGTEAVADAFNREEDTAAEAGTAAEPEKAAERENASISEPIHEDDAAPLVTVDDPAEPTTTVKKKRATKRANKPVARAMRSASAKKLAEKSVAQRKSTKKGRKKA